MHWSSSMHEHESTRAFPEVHEGVVTIEDPRMVTPEVPG